MDEISYPLPNLNSVTLAGRLGQAMGLVYRKDGKPVLKFVVITEDVSDRLGKTFTVAVPCELVGDRAERLAEELEPGDRVVVAEWHDVKRQDTPVSLRCVPLSMVGVAASKLGPAWDGVGFDPFGSSGQTAAQGMNPAHGRKEHRFRLSSCHSARSLQPSTAVETV